MRSLPSYVCLPFVTFGAARTVVLVLNEMVLVLVLESYASSTSTSTAYG